MKPLGVLEILRLRGFPAHARVKLIRHGRGQFDISKLIKDGHFETYQSIQDSGWFGRFDYIISFIGDESTRARFYGVYRITGQQQATKALLAGTPFIGLATPGTSKLQLERLHEFDVFKNRIIIDWGKAALSWHQNAAKDKEIIEIRPSGHLLEPFDDYLDFTLTFEELKHITKHEHAHLEWRSRLSAVAGIYLILDTKTGMQYVGSAYGTGGVWGRWVDYAKTRHGGNEKLKQLLEGKPDYADGFRFSLLQILPRSHDPKKVIALEGRYKDKLGSRAMGLNGN